MEPYVVEKNGKKYIYRATSTYDPKKKGPVAHTEYIGRLENGKIVPKKGYTYDESTGYFGPIDFKKPTKNDNDETIRVKSYGSTYFVHTILEKLGVCEDLKTAFGDFANYILATTLADSVDPGSQFFAESTFDRAYIKEILGIEEELPSIEEIYRTIGQMKDAQDKFFSLRLDKTDKARVLDLQYNIPCNDLNPRTEWSKERLKAQAGCVEPNLVTDKDGLPIMYLVCPGPLSDLQVQSFVIREMKRLGAKDPLLVLEESSEPIRNLVLLSENNIDFMMPLGIDARYAFADYLSDILAHSESKQYERAFEGKLYSLSQRKIAVRQRTSENEYNEQNDDSDGYEFVSDKDPQFQNCTHILESFGFRDKASARYETFCMDKILNDLISRMNGKYPDNPKKFFENIAEDYRNLLEWEMDESKGMIVRIRQNAHTFATNRKGTFLVHTPSESGRNWSDILNEYCMRDRLNTMNFRNGINLNRDFTQVMSDHEALGKLFIRTITMMVWMHIVKIQRNTVDFDQNKSSRGRKKERPLHYDKKMPVSTIVSLDNISIIYTGQWRRLTPLSKNNILTFNMFDIPLPKLE